jgi:hypothetical protein
MPCPEQIRLEEEFAVADSAWSEVMVSPVIAGISINQTSAARRTEALTDRNLAANILYRHRRGCDVCKRMAIHEK